MNETIYIINQSETIKSLVFLRMCGITHPDKNYEIMRTNSKTACIEYIDKGCGTVTLDTVTFHPCEGDTYFLFSGQTQHYYSDKDTPWEKYFINLSGPLVEELCKGYKIEDVNHFKGLNTKEELMEIIDIVKSSDGDCTGEILGILNKIFYKMHCHIKINSANNSLPYKMRDFLDMYITEKINMDQLYQFASKSESQAIKIFKKEFGITPYKYLCQKKIGLAKSMLKSTNLSVKEIAFRLNYADEYYFSNAFKQKVGISPSEYRKRLN